MIIFSVLTIFYPTSLCLDKPVSDGSNYQLMQILTLTGQWHEFGSLNLHYRQRNGIVTEQNLQHIADKNSKKAESIATFEIKGKN